MGDNEKKPGIESVNLNFLNYLASGKIIDEKLEKATKLERRLIRLKKRITKNVNEVKQLKTKVDRDTANYNNTTNEYRLLCDEIKELFDSTKMLSSRLLTSDEREGILEKTLDD